MAGVVVDVMEDLTDGSGSVTISAIVLKKEILKQVWSMSEILHSIINLNDCSQDGLPEDPPNPPEFLINALK